MSNTSDIDLRSYCNPEVPNNPGLCVPESVCHAFEIIQRKQTGHADPLSRMFCYYYARLNSEEYGKPSDRARIDYALAAARSAGITVEQDWPWDESKLSAHPGPEVHRNAGSRKIKSYTRLSEPRDVKAVLSKKMPVIMGFNIWSSFKKINKSGIMPLPDQRKEKIIDHHAVCIVGYRSTDDTLICTNNWGADWGDRGYFYVPYRAMAYPDFLISLWSIDSINIQTTTEN